MRTKHSNFIAVCWLIAGIVALFLLVVILLELRYAYDPRL